jgi:hypothetical protein
MEWELATHHQALAPELTQTGEATPLDEGKFVTLGMDLV